MADCERLTGINPTRYSRPAPDTSEDGPGGVGLSPGLETRQTVTSSTPTNTTREAQPA
jgi:hypothetical protein